MPELVTTDDEAPKRRRSRLLTTADMAHNRQAVLSAAKALFLARGYHHVNATEIAHAAGVASHIPNHYFGGKKVLFLRILGDLEAAILAKLTLISNADLAQLAPVSAALETAEFGDLERLMASGPPVPLAFRTRLNEEIVKRLCDITPLTNFSRAIGRLPYSPEPPLGEDGLADAR